MLIRERLQCNLLKLNEGPKTVRYSEMKGGLYENK